MLVRIGIPHLVFEGLHWVMFLTLGYNYLRSPFVQALPTCSPAKARPSHSKVRSGTSQWVVLR